MSKKLPSPCIDVCKFKREGHCIGCSMTKAQKKLYKSLKDDGNREAFIELLVAQQRWMEGYGAWPEMYVKRCGKKGVDVPRVLAETSD